MKRKKILAVIPARKGSKGIKNKNIKKFNGKPLIAWSIELAQKSSLIDKVILSTDDKKIAQIGKKYGADVPFLRPKELARDNSPSVDSVLHLLKNIESFDYILLLQPTSPLRKLSDINGIINFSLKYKYKSTLSISEITDYPQLMMRLGNKNMITKRFNLVKSTARQNYEKLYRINGALYFIEINYFKKIKSFISKETKGYKMPKIRSIDIDDYFDWKSAELLFKNRK